MKKTFLLLLPTPLLFLPLIISNCHKFDPTKPMFNYQIISNEQKNGLTGKQGIALDDSYYYVSNNNRLTKYNKQWQVVKDIDNVNTHFPGSTANFHIGDIEVYNNMIYTIGENFDGSIGTSIALGVFDNNLNWIETKNIFPQSHGINEVSGITIDKYKKIMWISSWCNGESGQYLYAFKYPTFQFIKKVETNPWVQKIQGIKYFKNYIFATADDNNPWSGTSTGTRDHLYRIDPKSGKAVLEHTFNETEFPDGKETEGITINEKTSEFLIMQDQGKDNNNNNIYVVNFFKTTNAQK